MKKVLLLASVLLATISFSQSKWEEAAPSGFELRYSFAGLGSNLGNPFAGFTLEGNHYHFVTEVNSCYDKNTMDPIMEYEGDLSDEVMSGLLEVFNEMSDTAIYVTNMSVMSGGVHTITMGSAVKMVKFSLHNASHPIAVKIVDLINSGLPKKEKKLWLHEEASNKTY